jgi:septal ring factor EnvC (AmiA/AmiB activator)
MSDAAKKLPAGWWKFALAVAAGIALTLASGYFGAYAPMHDSLARDLSDARASLESSVRQAHDITATNQRLESEIAGARSTNIQLTGQLESSTNQLTDARNQLTASASRIVQLTNQLNASQAELGRLTASLGSSQTIVNDIRTAAHAITTGLTDASLTVDQLRNFIEQLGAILGFGASGGGGS